MKKLSIVIISHNVEKLLKECIDSVYQNTRNINSEIIVPDNASTDGTRNMIKKKFPKVKLLTSNINTGFAKGNNMAKKVVTGDIVLFINADTKIIGKSIEKCFDFLSENNDLGAITCKVVLPNGKIDYSCHRGLPTPWNTFCYWAGLSKLFSKSKFFAGYTASYLNNNQSHYIDCVSGTFLMIRKDLLDKIGWWDGDYFWNGEDIEMCYQIKKFGYKIWYEASEKIIHYKGSSSGLQSTGKGSANSETKIRSAKSAAKAMSIFINKHWRELGPTPLMLLVRLGILLLEKYRLLKISLGMKYA